MLASIGSLLPDILGDDAGMLWGGPCADPAAIATERLERMLRNPGLRASGRRLLSHHRRHNAGLLRRIFSEPPCAADPAATAAQRLLRDSGLRAAGRRLLPHLRRPHAGLLRISPESAAITHAAWASASAASGKRGLQGAVGERGLRRPVR